MSGGVGSGGGYESNRWNEGFFGWGETTWDRELRDHVDGLHSTLHATRRNQRRLQAELSKATGSLEQRLDKLSTAFDAFVELSDLRQQFTPYDAETKLRHRARAVLDGQRPTGAQSDVDGYWLAPALAAHLSTVDGTENVTSLRLAEARDTRRATVFRVLAAGAAGRGSTAIGALPDALPELGDTVLMYQRAIWVLCADGHFGEAGRELIHRRGAASVARLDGPERDKQIARWCAAIKPDKTVSRASGELSNAVELAAATDACDRLAVLRSWVAGRLAGAPDPGEPDHLAPVVLRLLVDEGSEPEIPLLTRERELRAKIEGPGAGEWTLDTWDGEVGDTMGMLTGDVTDTDNPGRAKAAVRINASLIVAAAERLAGQARQDVSTEVRVRVRGGEVTITPDGPAAGMADKARERAAGRYTVDSTTKGKAWAAGGVGLLFALLAVAAGWGWLVPALIAFGTGGMFVRQAKRENADMDQVREDARQKVTAEIHGRVEQLEAAVAVLRSRQAKVNADVEGVRALLAEDVRVTA
ncbi:hypothetical protein EV193_103104 [Herbihabitans rhizosphaerae]|uniref:Uncharacterized protein n=1 Tax=Herbihabitans rhizosphaerae TaxID=1872711 RepID=A0A4Q7KXR1_9PSEU|nr:hypothetical protein [Herbihabitans rhizosphaerae]RZS40791.1 hypothetical protein EV193_103104 [Herbihabitans rhizosphaerae]